MSETGRERLNTLLAICCVTIIALVGMFIIGYYAMDGQNLITLAGGGIIAVAGLGGYEVYKKINSEQKIV